MFSSVSISYRKWFQSKWSQTTHGSPMISPSFFGDHRYFHSFQVVIDRYPLCNWPFKIHRVESYRSGSCCCALFFSLFARDLLQLQIVQDTTRIMMIMITISIVWIIYLKLKRAHRFQCATKIIWKQSHSPRATLTHLAKMKPTQNLFGGKNPHGFRSISHQGFVFFFGSSIWR